MNSFSDYFKGGTRNPLLGIVLVLLLTLELLTGGFWGFSGSLIQTEREPVLRMSQIEAPTIDEVAAVVSAETEVCLVQNTIPAGVWLFALVVISALLIWNFALALLTRKKLEWIPELIYVALAILAWAVLSRCQAEAWFPLVLVKASLIIFALYLYLFEVYQKKD